MKNRNRLFTLLLSVMMVLSFLPALAFAEDEGPTDKEPVINTEDTRVDNSKSPKRSNDILSAELTLSHERTIEGYVGEEVPANLPMVGDRVHVEYADGTEADFVGVQPEGEEFITMIRENADPEDLHYGDWIDLSYVFNDGESNAFVEGTNTLEVYICRSSEDEPFSLGQFEATGISDEQIETVEYHQARPTEFDYSEFSDEYGFSNTLDVRGLVQLGDYLDIIYTDGSTKRYIATLYSGPVGYEYALLNESDSDDVLYFTFIDDIELEKNWEPGNTYEHPAYYKGHQFMLDVEVVESAEYKSVEAIDFMPNGKTTLYSDDLIIDEENYRSLEARGTGTYNCGAYTYSLGGRFFTDGDALTFHYLNGTAKTFTFDEATFTFLDNKGIPPEFDWLIYWDEAEGGNYDEESLIGEHKIQVTYGYGTEAASDPVTITVLEGSEVQEVNEEIESVTYHQTRPIEADKEYFDKFHEYSLDSSENGKVQLGDYLDVTYKNGTSKRYSAVMYQSAGVGPVYVLRDDDDPEQAAYFTVNEDIEEEETWLPGNTYQCSADYKGHQFTLDVSVVERPSYYNVTSIDFTPNGKTTLYEENLPVTYEDEEGITTHFDLEARGNGINCEESLSISGRFFAAGDEINIHYQDGNSKVYTYDDSVFTFLDEEGNPPAYDWQIRWEEAGCNDPDFEWPELVGRHEIVVYYGYGGTRSAPVTITVLAGSGSGTSGSFGNGMTWEFSDGVLTISGVGDMPDNDYFPGEQMPWSSLSGAINSVVIGEGITSVGYGNFMDLGNLSEVTFPSTLKQIGVLAFSGCAIEDLVIPEGVTFIDESAFYNNKCRTARVTIPASLTASGMENVLEEAKLGGIFHGGFAEAIVSENNPDFKSVDGVVFSKDMSSLLFYPAYRDAAEFSIPETVKTIEPYAFYFNDEVTPDTYLKTLIIPKQVDTINRLYLCNLDDVYINRCSAPSGYVTFGAGIVPSQLVHVPEGAAGYDGRYWRRYANVVYDGVAEHDWSDEYTMDIQPTHLKEGSESIHCIYCNTSDTSTSRPIPMLGPDEGIASTGALGNNCTWKLYEDGLLVISGEGDMENFSSSYMQPWNGYYVSDLRIEDGVTSIGNYAFCYHNLASAEIADSVTKIGESCFYGSTLQGFKWSENLRTIGISAFSSSSFWEGDEIADVYLPDSVLLIGNGAFDSCRMKSITIPKNVRLIYSVDATNSLFSGCDFLERIDVDPDNQYYASADGVLIDNSKHKIIKCPNNTQLTCFVIPDDIEAVGAYAFYGNKTITSIQGGASLESIEPAAFYEMSSLEEVAFSDGLKIIGENAFANSTSLDSVTLPDSVTEIRTGAFQNCSQITEIAIPEKVSTITEYVFYGCSKLSDVSITGRITSIDSYAFYGCSSLKEFTILGSVNSVAYGAFDNCSSLEKVTILSKNCSLNDSNIFYPLATIYGIAGSTAQTYAENNRMDFVVYTCDEHSWNSFYSIDKEPTTTDEGVESKHCAVCDTIQEGTERAIPALSENESFSYGYLGSEFIWKMTGTSYNQTLTIIGDGAIDNSCFNEPATWQSAYVTKIVFDEGITEVSGGGFNYYYNLQQTILPESLTSFDISAFSYSGGEIVVNGDNTEIVRSSDSSDVPVLIVKNDSQALECAQSLGLPYDLPGGHIISNVEYTQEPTCNSEGWYEGYCDTCGRRVTERLPMTDHPWNDFYSTDVEPTRFEEGSESIHCSYCGAIKEGTERALPPTNYDYVAEFGWCGDEATWKAVSVDGHYELIISGSGSLYDLNSLGNTYVENLGEVGIRNWGYTSIHIEEGITGLGDYSLGAFGNVDTISIPSTVSDISPTAFADTAINNIDISSENAEFEKTDGVLFTKDHKQLVLYPASKEDSTYVIPDGVEQICRLGAPNVTDLTIPSSVTNISNYGIQLSSWATIHMASANAPAASETSFATVNGSVLEFFLFVPKDATGYDVLPWSGMNVVYGIPISEVQISEESHTFDSSEAYQLTCTILPEEAAEEATIQWWSDDESIASVDSNGYVTPVGVGSTGIHCSVNDSFHVQCQVVVPADVMTTYELTVQEGQGSGRFCAGQRVHIGADYGDDYRRFSSWETVEGNTSFDDIHDCETYVVMPESNLIVKPTYEPTELGQAIIDRDAAMAQLAEAEQSINSLNENLTLVNELNQQLQEIINDKDLTIEEKEDALREVEEALADAQAIIDNIPEDLQDAAQKIAEANAQILELQDELDGKSDELAAVQSDLVSAQAEIGSLNTALAAVQANYDQAYAALATANARIQALEEELDEKQSELDNKQTELNNANEALNAAIAEKNAALKAEADAKKAAEDAQTLLEAAQATIDELNETIDNMESDAAAKQAALEKAEADLENAEKALANAQTELAAAEKQVEDANNTIAQLQSTIDDKDGELAKAQKELSGAQSELSSTKAVLAAVQEDNAKTKQSLEEASGKVEDLQQQLDQANADKEEAEKAKADAQKALEQAQTEASAANKKIEELNAASSDKDSELAQAKKDLEVANAEIDKAVADKSDADKALAEAKSNIAELEKAMADKEKALAESQEQTKKAEESAKKAQEELEKAKEQQSAGGSSDQQGKTPDNQTKPSSDTDAKNETVKPEQSGTPVIKLSANEFTYIYKVVGKKKKAQAIATAQRPTITSVTLNGKTVSSNNYDVIYSNEESANIGTYSVTVTLKGSYSGKGTATYTINPKAVNLKKAAKGKKSFTASWKKLSKNDIKYKVIGGYQLRYSTDPAFPDGNTKVIKAGTIKSAKKAVKKLQAKTTYYVQLRTYKAVSGVTYYSNWSPAKTVVTK